MRVQKVALFWNLLLIEIVFNCAFFATQANCADLCLPLQRSRSDDLPMSIPSFTFQTSQELRDEVDALKGMKARAEAHGRSYSDPGSLGLKRPNTALTSPTRESFVSCVALKRSHSSPSTETQAQSEPSKRVKKRLLFDKVEKAAFKRNVVLSNLGDREATHAREALPDETPFIELWFNLFSTLCDGETVPDSRDDLSLLSKTLKRRYTYFSYVEPLKQVTTQVRAILGLCTLEQQEKTRRPCSPNFNHRSINNNQSAIIPWFPPVASQEDWHIIDCIRRLKGIISHNIKYRYDLDGEDEAVKYPKGLAKFRISVPWELLGILGSAAYYAHENNHIDIQRMFHAATPDLIKDFQKLLIQLQELQSLEVKHFVAMDVDEMILPDYTYSSLKDFATWYLHLEGLKIMKNNIQNISSLSNDLATSLSHLHVTRREGMQQETNRVEEEERLLVLRCFFVDGELSKRFVERSTGKINSEWTHLFKTLKNLRNHIKKQTKVDGQEKFEIRLNSLDPTVWRKIVESYCSVFDSVSDLSNTFQHFQWEDCKLENWGKMIPALNADKKARLKALEINLRNLKNFMINGIWKNDPAQNIHASQKRKGKRPISIGDFKDILKTRKWESTLIADTSTEVTPPNLKRRKSEDILIENLENFRWALLRVSQSYSKDISRILRPLREEKIREHRLVLARESANIIMRELPKYLGFNANNETRMSALLPVYPSSVWWSLFTRQFFALK